MPYRARIVPFAVFVAVALTGCTAGPQVTEVPTPSDPPTTATAAPEPDATEGPTPSPEPVSDVSLYPVSAYELCVTAVGDDVRSTGGSFEVVPYDEAEVVEREDGRFWVWAEYSDTTQPPELRDISAAHCILGGTVDDPEWLTFGQAARAYKDAFPPNQEPYSD